MRQLPLIDVGPAYEHPIEVVRAQYVERAPLKWSGGPKTWLEDVHGQNVRRFVIHRVGDIYELHDARGGVTNHSSIIEASAEAERRR